MHLNYYTEPVGTHEYFLLGIKKTFQKTQCTFSKQGQKPTCKKESVWILTILNSAVFSHLYKRSISKK